MKKFLFSLTAICLSSCSNIVSSHEATGDPDKMFVMNAAMSSNNEIAASETALRRSTNADVKSFASEMLKEHQDANEKLKPVAATLELVLPANPGPTHAIVEAHLSRVPAEKFDSSFIGQMVADHAMAVKTFEHASMTTKNPTIKKYVDTLLPNLKHHLEEASKLEVKLIQK